jgi:hypothetical protein
MRTREGSHRHAEPARATVENGRGAALKAERARLRRGGRTFGTPARRHRPMSVRAKAWIGDLAQLREASAVRGHP